MQTLAAKMDESMEGVEKGERPGTTLLSLVLHHVARHSYEFGEHAIPDTLKKRIDAAKEQCLKQLEGAF
jgi:hypothetical protein